MNCALFGEQERDQVTNVLHAFNDASAGRSSSHVHHHGADMAISVKNAQKVEVKVSVAVGAVTVVQVDLDDVTGANRVQVATQDWLQQDFNAKNPQSLDLTAQIRAGRVYWLWLLASALPGPLPQVTLELIVDGVSRKTITLTGNPSVPSQMARFIELQS
jgi:hypothetical protein